MSEQRVLKLSLTNRMRVLLENEIFSKDDEILISKENFHDLLKIRNNISEKQFRLIKSIVLLISLNVLVLRGQDFNFQGVSFGEIAGSDISSFLAASLSFSVMMFVANFQNQLAYDTYINLVQNYYSKGNVDYIVYSAWLQERSLFLNGFRVPFRITKKDNVKISSLGKFLYKLSGVLAYIIILSLLLGLVLLPIVFLLQIKTSSTLSIGFAIFAWVSFFSSLLLVIIPQIRFRHEVANFTNEASS